MRVESLVSVPKIVGVRAKRDPVKGFAEVFERILSEQSPDKSLSIKGLGKFEKMLHMQREIQSLHIRTEVAVKIADSAQSSLRRLQSNQ